MGDALARMVAYLDANPDVGIVGPYTHNSDGTYQSTRRRFPTLATAFFESTWLQAACAQSDCSTATTSTTRRPIRRSTSIGCRGRR